MRWMLLLLALPAAAQDSALLDRLYTRSQEEGLERCVPHGTLAALLGENQSCVLDFDACEWAPATVRGEPLAPEVVALLADLVKRDENGWAAACPGEGPQFLHQVGIKGLASAGAKQHLEALLALTTPEALPKVGENVRRLLAEALTWLGEVEAAGALTRLLALPNSNRDVKPIALMGLALLGHPIAVDHCTPPQLDTPLAVTCLHYLAVIKPEGAFEVLEAALGPYPEAASRALGLLGDQRALHALRRVAVNADLPARLAAQVSLLELGDESFLGPLIASLQAPEKLRKERVAKQKRPRKVVKKWKPKKNRRSRPPRPPRPPSPKAAAALMKELAALDVATRVAVECGRLTRPNERLDKALRAAAKLENDLRPQASTAALLALAQRGDRAAIQQLLALMVGATDPLRGQILAAVGAIYLEPWLPGRGRGVVADAAMLPALTTLAEEAESHSQRSLALRAAMNVRRVLKKP